MKQTIAKFLLFVYLEYIKEDWSMLTKAGQIYYYVPWFIRSIIMWLICPIFIPEYMFKQSKLYKNIQKNMKKMAIYGKS